MYCPKCRSEFVEGIQECDDCKVALIHEIPPEADDLPSELVQDHSDLITVFMAGNAGLIALAKSILEGAGIPYFAKGEGLQSLFGLGGLGTGFNPLVGPVQIQVPRDCEKAAVGLLVDLEGENSDDVS